MKISQNESTLDRWIRTILAVVVFIWAANYMEGPWQTVAYVVAAVLLLTALTGFCTIYSLFRISTKKQ